jgi:hypothetical protein
MTLHQIPQVLLLIARLDLLWADQRGADPAARHDQAVAGQLVHVDQSGRDEILSLWVPEIVSPSCDLRVFVDQAAEPVSAKTTILAQYEGPLQRTAPSPQPPARSDRNRGPARRAAHATGKVIGKLSACHRAVDFRLSRRRCPAAECPLPVPACAEQLAHPSAAGHAEPPGHRGRRRL